MAQVTPRMFTKISPFETTVTDAFNMSDPQVKYSDSRALSDANINERFALLNRKEGISGLTPQEKEELSTLNQELRNRDVGKANVEQSTIEKLFQSGGGGGGTGGGPAGGGGAGGYDQYKQSLDMNDYLSNLYKSVSDKIPQIYQAQQQAGIKQLKNQYGQQRGQAARELSAMGMLNSPAGYSQLANHDNAEYGAISDYINNLSGQQAQQQVGTELDIAGRRAANQQYLGSLGQDNARLGLSQSQLGLQERTSLAQLVNQARQFGQNFGLEREKFAEDNRRTGMQEGMQQRQMALSEELGRKQAQSEDNPLGNIMGIVSGLGGLAGGIGGLTGGLGMLNYGNAMSQSMSNTPSPSNYGYNPMQQTRKPMSIFG